MNITLTLQSLSAAASRVALILGAAAAIALLAACSDESEPSPSATPSAAHTSTPTSHPTPPTSTPTQVTEIPTYWPGTRTGIASIDPILVAVLAADATDIRSRLKYVDVPCTAGSPIPGPECPENVTVGTLVPAFPLTGCESTYERKDAIGPVVEGFVTTGVQLFAVYRVDRAKAGNLAPGDFGLVFVDTRPTPGDSGAIMVAVTADSDGRIVHWGRACAATNPQEFMNERPVSDYILPPL